MAPLCTSLSHSCPISGPAFSGQFSPCLARYNRLQDIHVPIRNYIIMNSDLPVSIAMAQQIVEQLTDMYEVLGLGNDQKDFMADVFEPMLKAQPDPNDLEDQLEDGEVTNLDLINLSCAYVVGAIAAESNGDLGNAWIAISHAQYWMGVAYGLGFMKGAAKTALKNRAHAGGKQRSENHYGAVREHARKLAQDHLEGTASNAARQIKEAVMAYQRENNKHFALGQQNPEKKIAEWLHGLPFKGKRSPRKPNVKS